MGYTTDFDGRFELDRPLEPGHQNYLQTFAGTRRVRRNAAKTAKREDPVRENVGLPVGAEGGFFVAEDGFAGQDNGPDVTDSNRPPRGQPGLWCQWVPNEEGTCVHWDGGEKFYDYTEWLAYLIEHFLEPWGYKLNGKVEWQGEDANDRGTIHVKDNVVQALQDRVVRAEPEWD
jgi:hypothetical protein